MAIFVKNSEQVEKMRESGRIVKEVLDELKKAVRAGITTKELDAIANRVITERGAKPSFLGYRGFPASICVSINNEVIHGIPGVRKLISGDIISIDVGAYKNGFHGDAARTYPVGEISKEAERLIEITRQSFFEGIKYARQGCRLHQISSAIQEYVEANGCSIVRDYVGHAVGKVMHEEPQIPNYKMPNRGPKLCKGMTLAIEPMVNLGTYEVNVLNDGWTVVTRDGKNSAHYENTVLITDGEPEILTRKW